MAAVGSTRPLRADAARNRTAILSAARRTFDSDGVYASLDGIALAAGVGNATLYRNFPTREDLLAAVIEDVIEELQREASDLVATFAPREALAEWLVRLTWQLRIWSDLPTCMSTSGTAASPLGTARDRLIAQTALLLDRARAASAVDSDIDVEEVFDLVTGLSWIIDRAKKDRVEAAHLVAVATAGLFSRGA